MNASKVQHKCIIRAICGVALQSTSPFVAVVRVFALADAVAVPAMTVAWVAYLPNKGGLLGTVLITVVGWWGIKRVRSALFSVHSYRFIACRVAKLVVFGLLLQVVAWAVR